MGLMKKLTSALVASSLVLSLVGSAFAAYTPAAGEMAGTRMQKLGMLQGRDGDLALNSEITRAELVTVIVRAFGKEDDAKLLKGSTIFPDIANHWASGNIAMAVALVEKAGSDPIGMPDGTFAPDAKLTPAQAVAFLMKFVGVKADANKAWPANYLDVAVDKGLITAEDKAILAPMVNDNATRGLVFYVFDRAFYNYDLGAGETFYTKYVDQNAPELTVTEPAATTMDSSITITGKATGATEVKVGSTMVTLAADGSFSYDLSLPELKDYDVTVVASDVAGNMATESFTVTRTVGNAAKVEAKLATGLVKAGAESELTVTVLDKNGNAIEDAAYDVEINGEIGTYADGVFTASATAGTVGTITVTSGEATPAVLDVVVMAGDVAKIVVEPATISLAVGQAQKFVAKGVDAAGNEVAVENVQWSASGGVMDAMGNFAATTSGAVTITAKAGDITGTAAVTPFAPAAKLAAQNVPDLVANTDDSYELLVNVTDANGSVVANSAANVSFTVSGADVKVNDGATATVAAVNGVAKVTVKSATTNAATGIITITSAGLTGTNVSYKTVARALTSAKVDVTPSLIGNDGASTTTAVVKFYDQKGVAMITGLPTGLNVKLTTSATDIAKLATQSSVVLNGTEGTPWTVTVNAGNNLGSATITGEVTAPEASKTIAVTAATVSTGLVGAPYQLSIDTISEKKAGEAQNITVRVKDVNGNQITNPNQVANLTLKRGTTTVATQNGVAGSYTFTTNVPTAAGTPEYTVEGTWSGVALVKATATGSVIPGAPATMTASFDATALNANGAHSSVLKATIKDANGNVVKAGNYEVTFEKAAGAQGATQAFTKTTVTSVEGVAQVTVTSGTANNASDTFNVSAKISATQTLSANASITSKVMGIANKFGGITQHADSSVVAGKGLILQAEVQDGASTAVTTDNGRPFAVTAKDADSKVVGTYTGTVVNGIAKVTITDLTKVGAYTFEFTSDGITKTPAAGAITITADVVAGITVTPDLGNVGNDGTTQSVVTVATVDKFGNPSNVATNTDIAVANSNPGLGTVSATTVQVTAGSNSKTFTYTAGTGLGSTTFTATATGLTTGTATINQVFVGSANKLAVNSISDLTSGSNLVFKVDIQDAQGARVTNAADLTGTLTVKIDNATMTATATQNRGQLTVTVAAATPANAVIKNAGSHSIEIASSSLSGKGTSSFISVPAAYDSVVMTASPTSIAANGSSTTAVTVKFADVNGNALADANGTATLSITTGNDYAQLLTNSVTITNGVGSFAVQAKNLVGTVNISAKMVYKDAEKTGTISIDVVPGVISNAMSTSVKGGNETTLNVVLRDVNGNWATNRALADFTVNAGYTVTSATHTGNGAYTVVLANTGAAPGVNAVTLSVGGVALNTVNLTRAVDAASTVTKISETAVDVTLVDTAAANVTTATAAHFAVNEGYTIVSVTKDPVTANLYHVVLGNAAVTAGAHTVTVTVAGTALTTTVSLTK